MSRMRQLSFWVLILGAIQIPVFAQQEQPKMSWDELVKVRDDSFARLREIKGNVQSAQPDEQQKMADEYAGIVRRMQDEIIPQLMEMVPDRLTAEPKSEINQEIAAELMRYSYGRNDYPAAKKMSAALLAADPGNDLAVNISGVSSFAMHEFEEANRLLTMAKERGDLIGDIGGRYLDTSKVYIDYWKKEQEIRDNESAAPEDQLLPQVALETNRGKVVIELFENQAPNTVANFISLVEAKFYDGLKFHRVIPGFMAQGGCPNSRDGEEGLAGTGGPGYSIKCEAYRPDARRHFSGSLSMAHSGRDTGGSQFFITHLPTAHLDKEVMPTSVHTVFGRVVEGLDVVRAFAPNDEIVSATVIRKRDHEYQPKTFPE